MDHVHRRRFSLQDHSLRKAHRPQGGGKIESVIGTVQRELWEVVHFDDVADAERALVRFFADYHNDRSHLGLAKATPTSRARQIRPAGDAEVIALPRLGGLHHCHEWRTAA